MPTCSCPGQELVGSIAGFSGEGRAQQEQYAIQNAYRNSGITDAYIMLMANAFRWECEGNCQIHTRFSIRPAPQTRQNPADGLWYADIANATLKVWVECIKPPRKAHK